MKTRINKIRRNFSMFTRCFICIMACSILLAGYFIPAAARAVPEGDEGGILKQEIDKRADIVSISLRGAYRYEVAEIFNSLLKAVPGVDDIKQYLLHLEPDNPQACLAVWQVRIRDIDAFQLESNIYRMIRDISAGRADSAMPDLTFEPAKEDFTLIGNIRPWRASSREIEFTLTYPLLSSQKRVKKPYVNNSRWHSWPDSGFE